MNSPANLGAWQKPAQPRAGAQFGFAMTASKAHPAFRAERSATRSAPNCHRRFPSPILRSDPSPVRPLFSSSRDRQFTAHATSSREIGFRSPPNPLDSCPITTTNRGSISCRNPNSSWPLSPQPAFRAVLAMTWNAALPAPLLARSWPMQPAAAKPRVRSSVVSRAPWPTTSIQTSATSPSRNRSNSTSRTAGWLHPRGPFTSAHRGCRPVLS